MVDRINNNNPDVRLVAEPARVRQTPENDFSSMVMRGAQKAAGVMAGGARTVFNLLPGGSFVTAVADVVGDAVGGGDFFPGLGGGDKWDLLRAQAKLQDEGMMNSLKLLALQRKMHQETQTYTMMSNVMKCRHEMAKRAINNIG